MFRNYGKELQKKKKELLHHADVSVTSAMASARVDDGPGDWGRACKRGCARSNEGSAGSQKVAVPRPIGHRSIVGDHARRQRTEAEKKALMSAIHSTPA